MLPELEVGHDLCPRGRSGRSQKLSYISIVQFVHSRASFRYERSLSYYRSRYFEAKHILTIYLCLPIFDLECRASQEASVMSNAVISEFRSKDQSCKPERRRLHERALGAICRALNAVGDKVAEAGHAQKIFDELNAMNDHELEDIGLIRSDIPAVVAGTYRGMRSAASNVITLDRRCRVRPSDATAALPKKPSAA
ncbi:DUF1127 domain-containing protein [Bradyrhizobium sp.]|uniref:DUF1127 domain-containing protein n=1 Tax=Bradyrhizobium sp. TaxID=376 RepID=UPI003C6FFC4E